MLPILLEALRAPAPASSFSWRASSGGGGPWVWSVWCSWATASEVTLQLAMLLSLGSRNRCWCEVRSCRQSENVSSHKAMKHPENVEALILASPVGMGENRALDCQSNTFESEEGRRGRTSAFVFV